MQTDLSTQSPTLQDTSALYTDFLDCTNSDHLHWGQQSRPRWHKRCSQTTSASNNSEHTRTMATRPLSTTPQHTFRGRTTAERWITLPECEGRTPLADSSAWTHEKNTGSSRIQQETTLEIWDTLSKNRRSNSTVQERCNNGRHQRARWMVVRCIQSLCTSTKGWHATVLSPDVLRKRNVIIKMIQTWMVVQTFRISYGSWAKKKSNKGNGFPLVRQQLKVWLWVWMYYFWSRMYNPTKNDWSISSWNTVWFQNCR